MMQAIIILLASLLCGIAASDPALLQQGVDVGNSATVGWSSAGSTRGCFTLTSPILPGKMFFFQKCSQSGYSFLAATVTGKNGVTGGGRLDFPCASFACAPSGGTITLEYQLFPPVKSKNKGKADDDHGEKNEGLVALSGQIGLMIAIARAKAAGGGADIAITIYGSVTVDVFSGLVSARGTISGILTFYNFKLSPTFGWSRVTFGIEIRV